MDDTLTNELHEVLKNKTILVTGGCGFIGSHLIRALLAFPCKSIHSIDHEHYGSAERLPKDSRVFVHKNDLRLLSLQDLQKLLDPSTIVFHLAAEKYNQSKHNSDILIETNCLGTHRLVRACALKKVQKLIFASSLYAYGKSSTDGFNETQKTKPHTLYGQTKKAGEALMEWLSFHHDIPTVSLRFFFVYGPEQYGDSGYRSVIYKNFSRLLEGLPPTICGNGLQTLDYIYCDDVIESLLRAVLYKGLCNTFNIGSGTAYSINTITSMMMELCNSSKQPLYISADQTADTQRFSASTKAYSDLGFTASTPLHIGLQRTLDWFKQHD